MHPPHRDAIRKALLGAAVVIDKFHVIDKARPAVNPLRIRRRGGMTRSQHRKVLRDRELLWKHRKELTPQGREERLASAPPDAIPLTNRNGLIENDAYGSASTMT